MTNYFNVSNVFESGRNNPDVSCERACMAAEENEYFSDIIDTLNKYQHRPGQRLSSKKLKEAVRRVMDEEEEEIERNINNITCHTPFQSPITKKVQKKDANWSLERRLAAGVLAGMVDIFKGCTIQSDEQVDTLIDSKEHVDARNWSRNDSAEQVDVINDSEKLVVGGSDPKSDPSVATHTTNGISATDTSNRISTRKLYPLFTKPVIQDAIRPIESRSRASFRSPTLVFMSLSPTQIGNQDIFSPSKFSSVRRDRNAEPSDDSIN